MDNGWDASAAAWIADMADGGDFGRRAVLDAPMLARVRALAPKTALDVGCGEGRFCRMLRSEGVAATGIDPTIALIEEARRRDPAGDYRLAGGEALPFADGVFDLTVSYLSLIDIPDYGSAIAEMARVTAPGGAVLVANLTNFNTASVHDGWHVGADGVERYEIDNYLEESSRFSEWRGIRIRNWHRPLSAYMKAFLGAGLTLSYFDEPEPDARHNPVRAARYRRAPWFMTMEWRKPSGS